MRVLTISCLILGAISAYICLSSSPAAPLQQNEIVINFDDVDATHDSVAASGYLLKKFGITLSHVTPGTQVVIVSDSNMYQGRAMKASSGHNVLTQINSNDPVEFTLNLPEPVRAVRFTRPKLIAGSTGITFPEWSATAFNKDDEKIGEPVGEPLGSGPDYYKDVPAKTFTLNGPGIKALQFRSDNRHFAAFSATVIDDLTLEK